MENSAPFNAEAQNNDTMNNITDNIDPVEFKNSKRTRARFEKVGDIEVEKSETGNDQIAIPPEGSVSQKRKSDSGNSTFCSDTNVENNTEDQDDQDDEQMENENGNIDETVQLIPLQNFQQQAASRKRGRPVGWRKQQNGDHPSPSQSPSSQKRILPLQVLQNNAEQNDQKRGRGRPRKSEFNSIEGTPVQTDRVWSWEEDDILLRYLEQDSNYDTWKLSKRDDSKLYKKSKDLAIEISLLLNGLNSWEISGDDYLKRIHEFEKSLKKGWNFLLSQGKFEDSLEVKLRDPKIKEKLDIKCPLFERLYALMGSLQSESPVNTTLNDNLNYSPVKLELGTTDYIQSLSTESAQNILDIQCQHIIPRLTEDSVKGESGRICVIGGSESYTGAPFLSAISALRLGADICHIICEKSAAMPIKSYSPEIIVHPLLRDSDSIGCEEGKIDGQIDAVYSKIAPLLKRIDCLVIGPGLGRDHVTLKLVAKIIIEAKSMDLPMIIDADGLIIIQNDPDIIKGYANAILTPNVREYERLLNALIPESDHNKPEELSKILGNITVVRKGSADCITLGSDVCKVLNGSPRRCGGQGDILSGVLGVFFCWAKLQEKKKTEENETLVSDTPIQILAAYAGCLIVRKCSLSAYEEVYFFSSY
ncbi:hypothetical protein HK099_002003 [Clydaea vesicula]|uniref:ATP-dependent (S)-NAD(P)H-hydrate dehydratase n=1 Tax=Clydaea vesicula TaxID=447962 RepID=A0AAD5U384_9FUNG|nr:hypothetical protein HK099_002003 [Clydaea vesicula]